MYFRTRALGDDTTDSIDSFDSGINSITDTSSTDSSGSLTLTPPVISSSILGLSPSSSSSSGGASSTPPPAPPAPAASSSSGTPWQAITGAIGSGLTALFAPTPSPAAAQTAALQAAAIRNAQTKSSFNISSILPWVALGGGVIVLAMVLRKKS